MNRLFVIALSIALAFPVTWTARLTAGEPSSGAAVSEGIAKMAWDLVRTAGNGNVILSPASVWGALAMTHAGARGGTAAEIAAVLGMPDDREQLAGAVESLRSTFKIAKGQHITLERANRLWVQRGKPLDPAFTTLLKDRHNAAAGEVDFAGASEAARAEVNKWVSDQTAGKIPELMKPNTIDPLTRLVLTNAIYFKGPWADPFDKSATVPEPFLLAGGQKAVVPFMHRSGNMTAGKVSVAGHAASAGAGASMGDGAPGASASAGSTTVAGVTSHGSGEGSGGGGSTADEANGSSTCATAATGNVGQTSSTGSATGAAAGPVHVAEISPALP